MFLKKAFHIINTCDPDISSWSQDGLSFVVKDPDLFASKVIPKCFKHSQFSSFVRQLNFYGFRKLRDEHVELESVDDQRAKWCHFRHPRFQRGRPDLLKEISKNTHKEVAEKTELEALRSEVKDLRSIVKNLKSDMGILASLVGDLSKQVRNQDSSVQEPAAKKQRIYSGALQPPTISTLPATKVPVPSIKPVPFSSTEQGQSRDISSVSLTSDDEAFLTSLFEEGEAFENLPDEVFS
jgi:hypothetical protein